MLKTALYFLSLVNAALGLFLAGAYFFDNQSGGIPVLVLVTGISLMTQGVYTIVYIGGALDDWHERATQLFVSGETAAILAGGLATIQGVILNLHPRNGDYEFLPMGLGIFMAVQATIGLIYASSKSAERTRQGIHQRSM